MDTEIFRSFFFSFFKYKLKLYIICTVEFFSDCNDMQNFWDYLIILKLAIEKNILNWYEAILTNVLY